MPFLKEPMSTEFKVVYVPAPDDRWEVHYGDQKVGYQAWDKRVALSYAKDMAKKNRPCTITIHDRKGNAEKQIAYPEKGSAVETTIEK